MGPTVERKTINISDILKNRNINIQKLAVPKEVEKEEVQKTKAPKHYENKNEKPQNTNKMSIEVTLNESESDEEDEDDEGDPFWFCGPPSDVLIKMNKVEQETIVRKETKDSKEAVNEGRKRKREDDDEDCGD